MRRSVNILYLQFPRKDGSGRIISAREEKPEGSAGSRTKPEGSTGSKTVILKRKVLF